MNIADRLIPGLKISIMVILATSTLSGCFDNNDEIEIPLADVPANIITTVQNSLPGIVLSEAEKQVENNSVIYELEGKLINGKEYEIEITDSGTIIKIELDD